MQSGNFLKKIKFYGVNFDSGICISMQYIYVKECMNSQPSFILCVKMGMNGPLYREICLIPIPEITVLHAFVPEIHQNM